MFFRSRLPFFAAGLLFLGAVIIGGGRLASARDRDGLLSADIDAIDLSEVPRSVLAHGRAVFGEHCGSCHAVNGKGDQATAVPDLTDGDFLYGEGRASQIEQIIAYGIRSGDSRGWNLASMPAFARSDPYPNYKLDPLKPQEIRDVTTFLRAANGAAADPAAVQRGKQVYVHGGCWDCHGADAAGDNAIGAPNLVDGVWLHGNGSARAIWSTLSYGLHGVSPAFASRLTPYDIRAAALYTATLHPAAQARKAGAGRVD